MTYILSFIVAFGVTAIAGQILIPVLRRLKAGQSIREDGPTWHLSKQGTPTMGGLMFILGIGTSVLTAGWEDLQNGLHNHLVVFLFALVFGAIGFVDDLQKLRHHANEGLTAPQKFLLQLAAAILFIVLLRNSGILSPNLYVPFFGVEWKLPWVVYMIFAALVITGTVNAVNITDGVDGLSSSVTLPVCLFRRQLWLCLSSLGPAGQRRHDGVRRGPVRGLGGLFGVQFLSCQGLYGGHGLPLSGGGRVRHGLRPGPASDPDPGGHHLHCGDLVGHHSDRLLQGHPRQAPVQDGADPPPL